MRSLEVCTSQIELHTLPDGRRGYRLELAVATATEMPAEIFVYEQRGHESTFSHVASPADLEEFPVALPEDGGYHRKSHVELVAQDVAGLTASVTLIRVDIGGLVNSLNEMDRLAGDSVTITG